MPVFYSLISRGHVVLCDHATAGVNLEGLALQALDLLGPSDERRRQRHGQNIVYTIVDHGLTYLCITDDNFSQEDAFEFLEQVQRAFRGAGLHAKALQCGMYALRTEFGGTLGTLTSQACGDNVAVLQTKMGTVQNSMKNNVEKLMARGDALADLEGRSEHLALNSVEFQKTAGKLKRKIMWKSIKLWVVLIVIIIIILSIIAILITLAATKKI